MKLFIKISVITVIVVVSGLIIFLMTLDINQYKPALVARVSEQTGREFRIDGELDLIPSLTPSITVRGISLGNPAGSSEATMLSVGYAVAKVSLLPLLSGVVHINQFILDDTRINLEKYADGSGNWVLDTAAEPAADSGAPAATLPPINIDEIAIRDAEIVFTDRQTGSVTDFSISEFTTAVTDPDDPIRFRLDAGYNEIPVVFIGTMGSISDLLAGNNYTLDISGGVGELDLSVNGSIANLMQMTGANFSFEASVDSLDELDALAGSELPGVGPFAGTGVIRFDSLSNINIEDLQIQLAESTVRGTLILNTADATPSIRVRLESDAIDLSPFASESEEKPEFMFSRDELPLAALKAVNIDLGVVIKLLTLPSIELVDNRLSLTLQNGNLQLNNEADVAGGKLIANIGLRSGTDNTASLTSEITGTNIKLELLPHEEERWFTGGATDVSITGGGRGASVADIMGSYNGKLLVKVGEATLPNSSIDMFGADILLSTFNKLNPLSGKEAVTQLQCAVINLPVTDGLIKLDRQIAIQTSKMYMVGSGEINLRTETLNLGVRPYAVEGLGLNLSSVAGAAKIGGTLANPRAEIDAANAIKTGVSAGAAVATGGLSLLAQGLFSKAGSDPEPCNTALGISTAASSSATDATNPEPVEQETGGNVIKDVTSGLKGLFGR